MKRIRLLAILIALAATLTTGYNDGQAGEKEGKKNKKAFTDSFMLEECDGFSSTGSNPFFILEPNYQLVLEGQSDGDTVNLTITVLEETRTFNNLDIGGGVVTNVVTRVVEEVEKANGVLVEISRNYFAICNRTNSVVYFGEDVEIYDETGTTVVSNEGAWLAGENDARPGIIMLGTVVLGARYFQEIAPEVALDRAEITSINETVETLAGTFENCLETFETTPLEKKSKEFKLYCPGIGLVQDADLTLISFGTLP